MTKRTPLESAAPFVPTSPTLPRLREAAAGCKACDLWERATQTVFGAGARIARAMFVGEQPGNEEDLGGVPFVGPAGRLLEKALAEAGIERGSDLRHQRRDRRRGEVVPSPLAPKVIATVHPSSILRAPDDGTRRAETRRFVADLEKVAKLLGSAGQKIL